MDELDKLFRKCKCSSNLCSRKVLIDNSDVNGYFYYYSNEWYYYNRTWKTNRLTSFEEVLDGVSEELQTKLLFHLDVFCG